MSAKVYGCNHVAIEVGDIRKAVAFYEDVFNLRSSTVAKVTLMDATRRSENRFRV